MAFHTTPEPGATYFGGIKQTPGKAKPKEAQQAQGKVLSDLLTSDKGQQRETRELLRRTGTPGALGVYQAEELLRWMSEHVDCLTHTQRVGLVSGVPCKLISSIEALEIRESIVAWWLRHEDPEDVDWRMELLMTRLGLPSESQQLLANCRAKVNERRLDMKLPKLRAISASWEQLQQWSVATGREADISTDAAVVASVANAAAGLRQELQKDRPLVVGTVTPEEARLWLLCCQWVEQGHSSLNPEASTHQQLQRKAAERMQVCQRLGVNHPRDIAQEVKRRKGLLRSNPAGIEQDSRGRYWYGDGTEAIPQADGTFRRKSYGLADVFDGLQKEEIWEEIERAMKQKAEQMEQPDTTNGTEDKKTD